MENLKLCNGRKIQQQEPHMIIPTDASTKGWGHTAMQFQQGEWSKEEKHFHINVVELLALKFTILIFTKNLPHFTIHVQIDNKVAQTYILKMGGTRSPQFLKISKSISNYLLSRLITTTAEHLPSRLNVSRLRFQECNRLIRLETSSKRLSENNQTHRNPNSRSIYLQAVSPTYERETRSKQFCNKFKAAGMEQNVWFCIPTLQLNRSGDKQGSSEYVEAMILVITAWQKQSCYTLLLRMAIQHPLLLPVLLPNLLLNPLGEKHPLVKTRSLSIAGMENYRKSFKIEGISSIQCSPSPYPVSSRSGSIAGYILARSKWVSWCCQQ